MKYSVRKALPQSFLGIAMNSQNIEKKLQVHLVWWYLYEERILQIDMFVSHSRFLCLEKSNSLLLLS